ncbi:hypothetical protein MRX96_012811 [Rhipicephalus microplus]
MDGERCGGEAESSADNPTKNTERRGMTTQESINATNLGRAASSASGISRPQIRCGCSSMWTGPMSSEDDSGLVVGPGRWSNGGGLVGDDEIGRSVASSSSSGVVV